MPIKSPWVDNGLCWTSDSKELDLHSCHLDAAFSRIIAVRRKPARPHTTVSYTSQKDVNLFSIGLMIGLSGRRYSKKKTFDNTLRDQIIGGAGKWEERH